MQVQRSAIRAAPINDIGPDRDQSAEVRPDTDSSILDAQKRQSFEKRQCKPDELSRPGALETAHPSGLRLADRPLQESEARYRAFFEGAPIGMFQMSPAGRLLEVNEAMAQILGYVSAEQAMEEAGREMLRRFSNRDLIDGRGYPATTSK